MGSATKIPEKCYSHLTYNSVSLWYIWLNAGCIEPKCHILESICKKKKNR